MTATAMWRCTIRGHELTQADVEANSGTWEQLYILVNSVGLPHTEQQIRPSHCPTCRNLIAACTLSTGSGEPIETCAAIVALMSTADVVDCFDMVAVPEAPAGTRITATPESTDDDFPAALV